jgi:GTP pyrophosphokinase
VRLKLRLQVRDFGQLSRLLGKIEGLPGIERAHRA